MLVFVFALLYAMLWKQSYLKHFFKIYWLFAGSSETGTKEEPLVAETINPVHIKQQAEIREKLAALKEKRLLNKKLG